MSRIAELKVNPQIVWKTLGPNQYTERPLIAITIRELLQNADDAVLATGRKDGEIYFEYEETNDFARLTCKDNGCGMTEDIILDKFLCLGESEKVNGSTGGFGIAKAAIIGACDSWELHSLDNYLDSSMVGNSPIKKKDYIEGTEITLYWDLNATSDALKPNAKASAGLIRGTEFIFLSKLSSLAEVKFRCNQVLGNELELDYEEKVVEDNKEFKLTLCKTKENMPSKIYFRLNGLVQFTKDFNNYTDLFFIVDIKTDKKPQDPNYPLGPSRETINYILEKKIRDITERYRINNVSGSRAFREKVNEVKYFPGEKIGNGLNEKSNYFYSSIPSKYTSESLIYSDNNPVDYEMIVRRVNSNAKIDIFADNNRKLLYVWAKVLELGAKVSGITKRESFGIGFILDDNTKAERYSYNEKIFYLINPKFVPISKPQEAIPKIIFLAAHELSHSFYRDHNEDFTIKESEIYFQIYEQFSDVKWLRKFLREGIY